MGCMLELLLLSKRFYQHLTPNEKLEDARFSKNHIV